jgi:hypothetical protein
MTVTATPIFPQTITSPVVQILPADTNTLKTLYTAGANGSRIENIMVTNTDSAAAYLITLTVVVSATNYVLSTINVPLSAGNTNAAPSLNLLNNTNIPLNKDSNGNPYLYLANGAVLKVNSSTTVNTAKAVSFVAQGGDY